MDKRDNLPRAVRRRPSVVICNELDKLRSPDGMLHCEVIHDWANNQRDSAIGRVLEWDDSKAGREYRLIQIRQLIRIHTVTDTGAPTYLSLRIDRSNGGGYRQVKDVLRTPDLRERALADALADLKRVQSHYGHLAELSAVWTALENAEREVQEKLGINVNQSR